MARGQLHLDAYVIVRSDSTATTSSSIVRKILVIPDEEFFTSSRSTSMLHANGKDLEYPHAPPCTLLRSLCKEALFHPYWVALKLVPINPASFRQGQLGPRVGRSVNNRDREGLRLQYFRIHVG
eukprot:scaffold469_cov282-Pinguiococcus_pyrenoidosus.AAC.2